MPIEKHTLAKAIYDNDNGESDFSDPSGEVTDQAAGAIGLAATLSGSSVQEIRDELTVFAQSEDQANLDDDELRYGELNEYNEFPHEANGS